MTEINNFNPNDILDENGFIPGLSITGIIHSRLTKDFNLIKGAVFDIAARKENGMFYLLIRFMNEREKTYELQCPVSQLEQGYFIIRGFENHIFHLKMDNEFLYCQGE